MKQKILIFLSFLSTISVISWIISDFFGGMIIFLLVYGFIIIPLLIIYVTTGIITLFKIIRKGINSTKIVTFLICCSIINRIFYLSKESILTEKYNG